MNDEPHSAIQMAGRTLRPIGNVTVWIVTAIAIAACASDHSDDPALATTSESQAVTTPAPTPTATPTTLETTLTVAPTTGTGFYTGLDHVAVAYAVPHGWESLDDDGWAVIKSGSDPVFGAAFWEVANIFIDPCQWVLFDPPVGPSVDELASAWAKVPAIEVTSTSDVTVDGYVGREVEFTVPNYDASECQQNKFGLWQDGSFANIPDYWAQGPNVHLQLWILDVEGTRLVVKASYFPNTSEQDRADLEEILDSIQIG